MTTVDTFAGAATDASLARIAADAPGRTGPGERVAFAGDRGAFLRLVVKGSLLLIPTFGFYRFWLATSVRRRLWAATRIEGEPLEWVGTGRELLVGFLIALAVLAPIYVGYFIIGILAESLQAFASVPLALILYVLGNYAAFRARRYRATRTVFRGLRFWMTGSGWAYAARAFLWDILTLFSLGLAYPWRVAALERYKMRHTHYGTLPGGFTGSGWTFFKRGWWLWLCGLLVLGLLVGVIAAESVAASAREELPGPGAAIAPGFATLLLLVYLAFAVPAFVAIETRWRLEGVRFGPVAASSDLRIGRIVWRYGKLFLVGIAYVLAIVLVGGLIAGAAFAFGDPASWFTAGGGVLSILLVLAVLAAYLVVIVLFSALKRRYLDFGLWEATATSVTLHGLGALDEVVARGAPASSLGEGLADALDVGGF